MNNSFTETDTSFTETNTSFPETDTSFPDPEIGKKEKKKSNFTY